MLSPVKTKKSSERKEYTVLICNILSSETSLLKDIEVRPLSLGYSILWKTQFFRLCLALRDPDFYK